MRLGTRGSALALAQAELVAARLAEAEVIRTADLYEDAEAMESRRGADADKSRWVSHLERALLDRRIDLAVHSAKDVPGELADGLSLLGAPARGAVEDVLVGAAGLEALAPAARVGTASLRRAAQLRAARADLEVVALEGNVDTRMRKLRDGPEELDAIVLARAGLDRLGVEPGPMAVLDPARFVPAPGQGVIALEGRLGDRDAEAAAGSLGDHVTLACLTAERAVARAIGASCEAPFGAHAAAPDGEEGPIHLRAWAGLPDGSAWIMDELGGELAAAQALGLAVAERMRAAGAADLLAEAREMVRGG
ncbi:MAG: hydroxymethylbilane synthase [Acidobacteriota bacterium]|nr:hydroxymethylbilane synthase [Acidobacteriota bacterium]